MRDLVEAAFRRGLLILGCGPSAIRLCPPLILEEDEARAALAIFEEAVTAVEGGEGAGAPHGEGAGT